MSLDPGNSWHDNMSWRHGPIPQLSNTVKLLQAALLKVPCDRTDNEICFTARGLEVIVFTDVAVVALQPNERTRCLWPPLLCFDSDITAL